MTKNVKNKNGGQTKLRQKIQALDYHNYQLSLNPKHKQADTIEYFRDLDEFPISKSSFNRWILLEKKLRDEFSQISGPKQNQERIRSSKYKQPVSSKLKSFMEANDHIIKCMELYFLQKFLVSPEEALRNEEIVDTFNKFKKIYHDNDVLVDQEKDDISWVWHFYKLISDKIDNIRVNFQELRRIELSTSSLMGEKARIYKELQLYSYDNIYYFNEIILDLDNLYELTNFQNEIFLAEDSFRNNEQDLLTGDIRTHKSITLSVCGNLNGTNFLPPLLISNIHGERNNYLNGKYNIGGSNNAFYYHPEGLNSHDILQNYFYGINTKLFSEKRRIKILLDNYWAHLGLFSNFSNIEFVFINSKFDRTVSLFTSSTLALPYDMGLERYLRYKLKTKLFKFFYKNLDMKITTHQFIEKHGDIIHSIIRCYYEVMVRNLKEDSIYRKFYELNIISSKLFNVSTDLYDDTAEERSKFKIEKGVKLVTFINSHLGKELSNVIKYNDKINVLYIREEEEELNKFVKDIATNVLQSNDIDDEISITALCKSILHDLTNGRNEIKSNKQYSDDGISKLIKKNIEFEHRKNNTSHINEKNLGDIDKVLVETIQPYLVKILSTDSPAKKPSNDEQEHPRVSLKTLELFTKFYDSYVNDTTILQPVGSNTVEPGEQEQSIDPIISEKSTTNIEIRGSSEQRPTSDDEWESPTIARHKKRLQVSQSPVNRPKIIKLFKKDIPHYDKPVEKKSPYRSKGTSNFKSTFSDDSGDDSGDEPEI